MKRKINKCASQGLCFLFLGPFFLFYEITGGPGCLLAVVLFCFSVSKLASSEPFRCGGGNGFLLICQADDHQQL